MNRTIRIAGLTAAALALIGLGLATAGCGEPAEDDPTPVKTWKITPAPGGQRTPTPAEATATSVPGDNTPEPGGTEPAATPSPSESPAPEETQPAGGTVLSVVGIGTLFDVTELRAPAGPVTIEFDNQDPGIVHNLAVYPGDDASEDPLGATDLEPGPIKQTLELDLEAGQYFYQCDSHPATMSGSLEVN